MLSKKAQYAFRALTVLVLNNGNGPFPISAIVKEYPISTKFLETILLELKRGGVLGSRKGKGGGASNDSISISIEPKFRSRLRQ